VQFYIASGQRVLLQGQRLVPDAEWDQFMGILRQELPSTFRITGTSNRYRSALPALVSYELHMHAVTLIV